MPSASCPDSCTLRLLEQDAFSALIAATRANADVFTRLKYLSHSTLRNDMQERALVITTPENTVIAAASLQPSPYEPRRLWVLGVSVDARHRRQGHATTLLRGIFAHAAACDMVVEFSSFSDDGQAYLAPVIPRIHRDFAHVAACTSRHPRQLFDGTRAYRLDGHAGYTPMP